MKKVLLFCLMGLVVVGCKDKKDAIYNEQRSIVTHIFEANNLNPDKTDGRSDLTELQKSTSFDFDRILVKLDLSNLGITIIPPEIGLLTGLVELDLSGNKIEELPEEIGNLVKLEKLDVRSNRLRGLPSTLGNLESLTELGISFNRIEKLPESMTKLTNIRYLELGGNDFGIFPAVLTKMPNLGSVQIDFQSIDTTTIPAGVRSTGHGRYVFD